MNKRIVTTTLAVALGVSSLGAFPSVMQPLKASAGTVDAMKAPAPFQPIEASAATVSSTSNQKAVEAKADEIIKFAKSLIGKATYGGNYSYTYPYQFKCASFIDFVFQSKGVHLGSRDEDYMIKQGTYVPRSQLQKGDLVFFRSSATATVPNHAGIYIGDNKIIHMANTKLNITISDLDSTSYYRNNYMTARRVLPSLLPSNPPTKADNIVEDAYDLMDNVTMGRVNDEKSMKFTGAGYVNYIYKLNGVNLGKTSVTQLSKLGKTVSRSNLKKGDLIFINSTVGSTTPTRVAIYAGEHRIIVPSSQGISSRVLLSDYYSKHYMYAKRVY
ncbi:NlpC/P60 family protein [Bacillus sp. DTU_2020_1000418_1_SI_GHA_SEK_038]|uniref:C40 family peptidase n=1 Tax=Bacillus sp. DTU_2020_1000418_1_SI_GHA_SEK_038 TaxID=3077585 RepID=UPI0028E48F5C|nr:NlpC/P60 family protein [Bacillus sp. DTU_2020_1000418_1_SI_GHA_SEK_038]WNS75834.1 NlpC/P60 family protein [Bacillus sp. DTU_2020_1000418_1_SI_GHA_SEK_038]